MSCLRLEHQNIGKMQVWCCLEQVRWSLLICFGAEGRGTLCTFIGEPAESVQTWVEV